MKVYKIICSVICLVICMSILLTGCGVQQGSNVKPDATTTAASTTKEAQSNLTEPGTFPVVKEKVTLKVFMAAPVEDIEQVYLTKYWEEKTNVHVDWQVSGTDGAKDKINLMLASSMELPDVIIPGSTGAITNELLYMYGMAGTFIPLNDLIEKQGYYLKEAFKMFPEFKKQMTAPDGVIYGIMDWNECFHCLYSQRMWVNKDWMAKLNMKHPTTTDEFYNMLKAFKANDLNGNGTPDEIPLIGSDIWRGNVDGFLMNPFILNNGDDRLNIVNGKVVPAFTQPEWREGLRYLNKLHSEGLLDTESFIMTGTMLKSLAANNQLGAVPAGNIKNFVDMSADPLDLANEKFEVIAPLKGPSGLQQTPYFPTVAQNAKFVITKYCKEPEVALRWVDGFFDESDISLQGEENNHWRKAEPGEIGFEGKPAVYAILHNKNAYWGWAQPFLRTNEYRVNQVYDPSVYNNEKVLYDSAKPYVPYAVKDVYPPIFMSKETAASVAEYKNNINEYVKECIAKFITGGMNLDTDWDKYLAELNKMDLDGYIKLMQEAYDAYMSQK